MFVLSLNILNVFVNVDPFMADQRLCRSVVTIIEVNRRYGVHHISVVSLGVQEVGAVTLLSDHPVLHLHCGHSGTVGPKTGQHLFELFAEVLVEPGIEEWVVAGGRHGHRVC